MVGKKYEEEGIIKAGVHFVNAVSNSEVPAITIMIVLLMVLVIMLCVVELIIQGKEIFRV